MLSMERAIAKKRLTRRSMVRVIILWLQVHVPLLILFIIFRQFELFLKK